MSDIRTATLLAALDDTFALPSNVGTYLAEAEALLLEYRAECVAAERERVLKEFEELHELTGHALDPCIEEIIAELRQP